MAWNNGYYEDSSTLSEGLYGHTPSPEQRDWFPDLHPSGGFVASPAAAGYPSGTPLNAYFGPGDGGSVDNGLPSDRAHYYSGYWAGVQARQYASAPPVNPNPWGPTFPYDPRFPWDPGNPHGHGPNDGHPFLWKPEDLQWKPNTRVASLSTAHIPSNGSRSVTPGTGGANIAVNPNEMMWLSPAPDNSSWDMGRGVGDFPADLQDWGGRPLPPIPLLVPMAAPRTGDGTSGVNWTSATNLYGEPTGVPVVPVMPVAPPEWNIPAAGTGLSGGSVFSGGAGMLTDIGAPNWIEDFFPRP